MLTVTVDSGSAVFHFLSPVYVEAVEGCGKFMSHASPLVPVREAAVPAFAAWPVCFIEAAAMVEHAVLHRRQCFPQRRDPVSD